MSVDGEACGRAAIPAYMRMVSSVGSSVGQDHGSAVSSRYRPPFAFTGTLHEVVIQLPQSRHREAGRDSVADETAAIARTEMSRQ